MASYDDHDYGYYAAPWYDFNTPPSHAANNPPARVYGSGGGVEQLDADAGGRFTRTPAERRIVRERAIDRHVPATSEEWARLRDVHHFNPLSYGLEGLSRLDNAAGAAAHGDESIYTPEKLLEQVAPPHELGDKHGLPGRVVDAMSTVAQYLPGVGALERGVTTSAGPIFSAAMRAPSVAARMFDWSSEGHPYEYADGPAKPQFGEGGSVIRKLLSEIRPHPSGVMEPAVRSQFRDLHAPDNDNMSRQGYQALKDSMSRFGGMNDLMYQNEADEQWRRSLAAPRAVPEYADGGKVAKTLSNMLKKELLPDSNPRRELYIRFGKWPENERSANGITDGLEKGVSVYPTVPEVYPYSHDVGPAIRPDASRMELGGDYDARFSGAGAPTRYHTPPQIVQGRRVGYGADGEPVLRDVKSLGMYGRTLGLPDDISGAPSFDQHYADGGKVAKAIRTIRNSFGSLQGARMEQAADLTNLDRYSTKGLLDTFSPTGDFRNSLYTVLPPSSFEDYALQLPKGAEQAVPYPRWGESGPGRWRVPTKDRTYDNYIDRLQNHITSHGMDRGPEMWMYKNADDMTAIEGHEGRHRTRALDRLGDENSLVRLNNVNDKEFGRDPVEEAVTRMQDKYLPQGDRTPILPQDLPILQRPPLMLGSEGFAEGGDVEHHKEIGPVGKAIANTVKQWVSPVERASQASGATPEEINRLITKAPWMNGSSKSQSISLHTPRYPYENVSALYSEHAPLDLERIIRPEDLKGGRIFGTVGDRLTTDQNLLGINGDVFKDPVQMHGGPDYARGQAGRAGSIWASDKAPVGGYANLSRQAVDEGLHPFLTPMSMGRKAVDSTKEMTNVLGNMAPTSKIKRADLKDFDDEIRKMGGPFTKFPGLKSPRFVEWQESLPTSARSAVPLEMDRAYWADKGFPDVGAARLALTGEEHLANPMFSSGRLFSQPDLERARISDPELPHPNYSTQIGGKYTGGFGRYVPPEVMFPEDYTKRLQSESPARSIMMSPLRQDVTPEWIDRTSQWLENADREGLPKAEGGHVKHGHDDDLYHRFMFGFSKMAEGGRVDDDFLLYHPEQFEEKARGGSIDDDYQRYHVMFDERGGEIPRGYR